jgi:hypothetical protein
MVAGWRRAKEAGVPDQATFVKGDLFEADLSKATMTAVPAAQQPPAAALAAELKPGTDASGTFDMGDWQPDAEATSAAVVVQAVMWVVPARSRAHGGRRATRHAHPVPGWSGFWEPRRSRRAEWRGHHVHNQRPDCGACERDR